MKVDRAELGQIPVAAIAAAALITILDGFDAFSLALTAPHIAASLRLPTAALGAMFSVAMAGMIAGAMAGSALADQLGRLRVLIAAMALFGGCALLLPLATSASGIAVNRFVAGVGLGAAGPIAVAMLNRAGVARPSPFTISLVWAGIPLGGSIAALFNYAIVPAAGWHSIFLFGGLLPVPIAVFAWLVWRGHHGDRQAAGRDARARVTELFAHGRAMPMLATAAMFFFGYMTTSIIVNWLPTILTHKSASPATISATFGAINGGGVVAMIGLGFVASRVDRPVLLPLAWLAAAACGLASGLGGFGPSGLTWLAIGGATVGAAAQAISVARANEMQRGTGLESTAIGFMTGCGRVGQACALGVSGLVIGATGVETMVFVLAGMAACGAALLALVVVRPAPAGDPAMNVEPGATV